jgi:osmotically-inducible protein OsmY
VTPNERICAQVVDELRWLPDLGTARIGVEVDGDAVTLRGVVTNIKHRFQAECAARRVNGVARIRNGIQALPISAA